MDWKHKRQSKIVKATLGAAVLGTLLGGYGSVWAADNIIVDGTQDGSKNTVEADKSARVVGTENTVNGGSEEVKIVGDRNTVTNSDRELIFGDDNSIIGRDVADTNGEVRANNVSDIIVGKGNTIQGHATWGKRDASATIIGNNNTVVGGSSGIIIGDNQKTHVAFTESIFIGGNTSNAVDQLNNNNYGNNSTVIGFETLTKGVGHSVVIGNRSTVGANHTTLVGLRSNIDTQSAMLSSVYGAYNRIENAEIDKTGFENWPDERLDNGYDSAITSISGVYNNIKAASGTLILGSGNTVTNSDVKYKDNKVLTNSMLDHVNYFASYYGTGDETKEYWVGIDGTPYDTSRDSLLKYIGLSSGNASVIGSGNIADYVISSQILGSGNTIKGSADVISVNNTISGSMNQGENVINSAIIGSSNTVKNIEDNVVIGDYHVLNGGSHNIILGSMSMKEEAVTESYFSYINDESYEYTKTIYSPIKEHTANISNAVMLGYNTDVSQNGGVALGSESVGSVGANNTGGYNVGKNENNFKTGADTTWNSNLAAISVGDSSDAANVKTRQITNLAAGKNDTDAVNVAQLKSARVEVNGTGNITVSKALDADGHIKYTISSTGSSSEGGSGTTYTPGDNISITDGVISAKDTRNTLEAGDHVVLGETKLTDGSIKYKVNVKADGKVESGNTGLVTGGAIYNETRVSKDGNYVKRSNTAGQNLVALDSQVKTNTDSIQSINSQITDMNSSVANLGNQVNRLDNRIERVGAGAAALAALHPQDFDPDAKWDIAAGYGHYRSANAVAIGAFYRPSTDMMFSIGTSLGGGENMINAGVSLKLGSSSPYTGYSKAALANVVAEQSEQLNAQSSTISELREKVELQAQENEALRTQVQDIMRQLAEIKK